MPFRCTVFVDNKQSNTRIHCLRSVLLVQWYCHNRLIIHNKCLSVLQYQQNDISLSVLYAIMDIHIDVLPSSFSLRAVNRAHFRVHSCLSCIPVCHQIFDITGMGYFSHLLHATKSSSKLVYVIQTESGRERGKANSDRKHGQCAIHELVQQQWVR